MVQINFFAAFKFSLAAATIAHVVALPARTSSSKPFTFVFLQLLIGGNSSGWERT